MAGEFEVRVVRIDAYRDVADRMKAVRAGETPARVALIEDLRAAAAAPAFRRRNGVSGWRLRWLDAELDRWEREGVRPPRDEQDVELDISLLGETAVFLLATPDFAYSIVHDAPPGVWNFAPYCDGDAGLYAELADASPWVDKMSSEIWGGDPELPLETMLAASPAIAFYPRAWLGDYLADLEAYVPAPPRADGQRRALERHRDLARRALDDPSLALSVYVLAG